MDVVLKGREAGGHVIIIAKEDISEESLNQVTFHQILLKKSYFYTNKADNPAIGAEQRIKNVIWILDL